MNKFLISAIKCKTNKVRDLLLVDSAYVFINGSILQYSRFREPTVNKSM